MRSAFVRSLLALLVVACAAPERPERNLLQQPAPSAPALAAAPASPAAPSGGPARVPLTVRETAGIGRTGEVLRSGVPLPPSLGVRDTARLAVVDAAGHPVPAEFRVLARWNAGRDDAPAPIQWLLVAFPATVPAKGGAVYSLVTDGSAGPNPPPSHPLRLSREGRDGEQVVVDTGAAVFRLGGRADALLDEVLLPGGRRLAGGAGMELRTVRPAAASGGHSKLREVRVESAGPLSAVVLVDGAYDLPPVGTGGFGSRRRYVFTAGSPVVVVRQAVAWEGDLGEGIRTKDGQPNGVRVERARDTLALDLGGPATALIVGSRDGAPLTGAAGGVDASLRQLLRGQRKEPLRFEMTAGPQRRQGSRADAGMLAASGPAGAVAVALNHMDRYEPQALRLSADGRLAIDLVDGAAWLAFHQGLFATFAVAALPAAPARSDLDRLLWAPLNRPLRAWPDAAWFTASQAVDEVPAGALPKRYAAYDKLVPATLEKTVKSVDAEGLNGLMTYGLYPRYWESDYAEVDCKEDPTPGEAWDNPFWCATWTDYHNTTETAAIWAMRTGQVEWLDEIGFPAALRTLHTQILQCGPEQKWFYCGQSPMGYGAYRDDFNSSHAYFENLFLYYWLTGDSTVVDLVQRGGDSMRRLFCPDRGPGPVTRPHGPEGPACAATHPPDNDSANFTGRQPSQWIAAFRFLGLASGDASFLEDYRSGLARALTQQYAELLQGGRRYGLLGTEVVSGPGAHPGPHEAGPFWTNGYYDAENLYRWQRDTGDQPLGEPPLKASEVLAAVARTVSDLGPRTAGGTPDGPWPRLLAYSWSGPRIGGTLTAVEAKDRELYGPEQFGTVALLVRAGRLSGDPVLIAAGERMIQTILRSGDKEILPLGKIQGQTLTRLHAAVALAASGAGGTK
ncbi:MAG: hypothetical protein JF614_10900 [Acidobacteria bacterium]|nr:hypothetical protein [Acidobacteriota bacterium]